MNFPFYFCQSQLCSQQLLFLKSINSFNISGLSYFSSTFNLHQFQFTSSFIISYNHSLQKLLSIFPNLCWNKNHIGKYFEGFGASLQFGKAKIVTLSMFVGHNFRFLFDCYRRIRSCENIGRIQHAIFSFSFFFTGQLLLHENCISPEWFILPKQTTHSFIFTRYSSLSSNVWNYIF